MNKIVKQGRKYKKKKVCSFVKGIFQLQKM